MFSTNKKYSYVSIFNAVAQPAITNCLHLRRSEVLRSLRQYRWIQIQGHHTTDHPEKRRAKRGSMKGKDRPSPVGERRELFQGSAGETADTWDGARKGFPQRRDNENSRDCFAPFLLECFQRHKAHYSLIIKKSMQSVNTHTQINSIKRH